LANIVEKLRNREATGSPILSIRCAYAAASGGFSEIRSGVRL